METTTDRPEPGSADPWPLDGPDSRWVRAQRGAVDPTIVSGDDAWVRMAADFLALRRRNEEASRQRYPRVTAAWALWRHDANQRTIVIMTLAGCPAADIAARLKTSKDAVRWAQQLFFDVAERRHAVDWIYLTVIKPRSSSHRADYVSECWAALYGGPRVANVILDGDQTIHLPPHRSLEARETKLALKTMTALKMPLSEREGLRYLKLTLEIQRDKDRLEFERQKLAHRCVEAGLRAERAADAKHRKMRFRRRLSAALAAEEQAVAARAAASPLHALTWTKADADAVAPPPVAIATAGIPPRVKNRRLPTAALHPVAVGAC